MRVQEEGREVRCDVLEGDRPLPGPPLYGREERMGEDGRGRERIRSGKEQ